MHSGHSHSSVMVFAPWGSKCERADIASAQLSQKAPYISISWPEKYFLVYTHVHKNCARKPENAVGHVISIP